VLHVEGLAEDLQDALEVRLGVELDQAAVAGALEALRHGALDGLYDRDVAVDGRLLDDADQPVVDAAEDGVDGRVRAVDGDVVLGQAQDDALVRVVEGDGLEAAEDEGVWGVSAWAAEYGFGLASYDSSQ
jgi:hypothetical protein